MNRKIAWVIFVLLMPLCSIVSIATNGDRPTVSNGPRIRAFLVNPGTIMPGGRITIEWRVEPREEKRPAAITEVAINSSSLGISIRTGESAGTRAVTIPSGARAGTYQIVLSTADSEGRLSTRTIDLQVVPDEPIVKEFSADPPVVVTDHDIRMRWRVEPPPGGSAIRTVTISPDVTGALPAIGERTVRIPSAVPRATRTYTLTAENMHGRSATQTVAVEVRTMLEMERAITVERLVTEPREFQIGMPVTFHISINNTSRAHFHETAISLFSCWGGTRSQAAVLNDVVIAPGVHSYTIRAATLTGHGEDRLTHFRVALHRLGEESGNFDVRQRCTYTVE